MGIGDELRDLIRGRLKIINDESIVCPREKSDMTPCVARDGDMAATEDLRCIGCGARIVELKEKELEKRGERKE